MSDIPPSESTSTTQTDSAKSSLEDRFPFLRDETGKKRVRTLLTHDQAEVLQKILARTAFPSTSVREAAAQELGISPRKVQVWLQNVRQKHRRLGGNILKCARRYRSAPGSQSSIAANPQSARTLTSPTSDDMYLDQAEAAAYQNRFSSPKSFYSSQVTQRHRQQHQQRLAADTVGRGHVHAEQLETGTFDHLTLTQTLQDKLGLQSPPSTVIDTQLDSENRRLPALASSDLLTQHRGQSGRGHNAVSSDPLNVPLSRSRPLDLGRTLSTAPRPSASHLSAFSFPPPHSQIRRSQEAPPYSTYSKLDVPSPTRPRAGTLAYGSLRGRRVFDLVRSGLPLQHPSARPPLQMQCSPSSELLERGAWPTHEGQQYGGPHETRRSIGSLSRFSQPKGLSSCGSQMMSRRRDITEVSSEGQGQSGRSYTSLSSRGAARASLPSIRGIINSARRKSDISETLTRPVFGPMHASERTKSAYLPHSTSPFSSMTSRAQQSSDSKVYHYRGASSGSALSVSSLPSGMHTVGSSLGSFASPAVESPGDDQGTYDAIREESIAKRALDMGQLQRALSDVPQPIEIEVGSADKAATMGYGHRYAPSSYRLTEGTDGSPGHTRSPFGSISGLTEANRMRNTERRQVDSHDHSPYSLPARSPSLSPPHHPVYGARSRSMSLLSLEEEDALTLPPILSLLVSAGEEGTTAGKSWQECGEQRGEDRDGHAAQVCKLPGIAHLISPRSL